MLSVDETLNDAVVEAVLESGHSRIPVHRGTDRTDIVGLVLVKELLSHVRKGGGQVGVVGDGVWVKDGVWVNWVGMVLVKELT